ncbi:MAG: hypothetical protein ACLUVC_13175 [Longibaculum sp.]
MFKVDTIEQFKVLQFIKENFDMKFIELELLDKFSIKVSDYYCDELIFKFNPKNGEIEYTNDEFVEF